MAQPFLLFHWSLATRRKGIRKYGLCPGKKSRDGLWRPPYVAFSTSPSKAWGLSALCGDDYGEWDLWMTWSNRLQGYEKLPGEYRVYHRVMKRNIWYVGSRIYAARKNRTGKCS